MIISHDSFTYQKPKNILLKPFACFWRTQKLNIDEQYKLGVRIFDVRVYRNKNKWGTAHGLAHFDKSFNSLIDICKYFKDNYNGSMIRIILEDNVNYDQNLKKLFYLEAEYIFEYYKDMIWEIGTHHPWEMFIKNDKLPFTHVEDNCCHLFNWNTDKSISYNIKRFDCSSWSLPSWAKKHNVKITKEMIEDNIGHMFDYIGIYP